MSVDVRAFHLRTADDFRVRMKNEFSCARMIGMINNRCSPP